MIVYGPIMKMLSENGWSSYRIRTEKALSEATVTRIRQGKPINTTTIDAICRMCHCQPGDIMKWVPDSPEE